MLIPEDQIKCYTREQCEQALKSLDKKYKFDRSVVSGLRLAMPNEEFDLIVNTVCDLEQQLESILRIETNEKIQSTKLSGESKIMTPKGLADTVEQAAEMCGYKRQTILQYLLNYPDQYYRVYDNLDE